MNNIKFVSIPGDGIGKEVMKEGIKVLEALVDVDYTTLELGAERYLRTGELITEDDKAVMQERKNILFGAIGDPRVQPGVLENGILLEMRFHFDQYINLRPIVALNDRYVPLKWKKKEDINFTVVRENTEGSYYGGGGILKRGGKEVAAVQEMLYTREGVERVVRFAFELALERKKKVALVDKCNVLTHGHKFWHNIFYEIAEQYPEVETQHYFVDAMAMEFIRAPERLDVVVTSNMFGDILTDLGAQIQGGLGMGASGNINPKGVSMYEPIHGSAPDIAGKGIANPVAMIMASALMLETNGLKEEAEKINRAVELALDEGMVTPDMGGKLKTHEVGDYIARKVHEI